MPQRGMSAFGTKRTSPSHSAMSAFGGKADIRGSKIYGAATALRRLDFRSAASQPPGGKATVNVLSEEERGKTTSTADDHAPSAHRLLLESQTKIGFSSIF